MFSNLDISEVCLGEFSSCVQVVCMALSQILASRVKLQFYPSSSLANYKVITKLIQHAEGTIVILPFKFITK
jgi:hypothetical protein